MLGLHALKNMIDRKVGFSFHIFVIRFSLMYTKSIWNTEAKSRQILNSRYDLRS